MCLILFAYNQHPKYKLVIAANRDEFYHRPTKEADFWNDHPNLLAGRDLEGQGTWMGVTKSGRLSLLTNYRDLSNIRPNAPTRGKLVTDFLVSNQNPQQYLNMIHSVSDRYNGFNILLGSVNDLWYYSNYQKNIYMLGSGVYGLSNELLDSPWPKVQKGKQKLKQILKSDEIDQEELFESLFDDFKAPDQELPETGVGIEMERMLSPMFIKSEQYGTRCSTLLLADHENNVTFLERTYDTTTFAHETKKFEFSVKNARRPEIG